MLASRVCVAAAAVMAAPAMAVTYGDGFSGVYPTSLDAMFDGACGAYPGHVYEVENATQYQYSTGSSGDYRQPYQEFLDAMNARRCMHAGPTVSGGADYTAASNLRWVKALAYDAQQYLYTNGGAGTNNVASVGAKTYLTHSYLGSTPSQIQEVVRHWYETKSACVDNPDAGVAGCTVTPASDTDTDTTSPVAFMRMVWLRSRSLGCACVDGTVACVIDAGASLATDADSTSVVSTSPVQIRNICDSNATDSCASCDEIAGGSCQADMVGATRTDRTLDSCAGVTTSSVSVVQAATAPEAEDEGLADITIIMIIVSSVVALIIIAFAIAFRHEATEALSQGKWTKKYFKNFMPKLWKKEEKGAIKLAQARTNELSLKRKTMRETIKKAKKSHGATVPSVMMSPMYNPMVNAPAVGDPAAENHETEPAQHFITADDVLSTHKDLIQKRKSIRLKSIKQKESSIRKRAAAAAPHSEFKSEGEVSL